MAEKITQVFVVIEKIDNQPQSQLARVLSRLNHTEQIRVIMTHPFFTGQCPECKAKLQMSQTALGKCHCPACGWIDQSLKSG